jgi:hypothetical protein
VADLSVTHYIHGGLPQRAETYTMQILRQKSQPTATPDLYSISDVRVGFDGVLDCREALEFPEPRDCRS